jgi:hypothetical protein
MPDNGDANMTLVLLNRSAQRASQLISLETVRGSGEEVARIHSVAAPKVEQRTAELAGAEGSKRD